MNDKESKQLRIKELEEQIKKCYEEQSGDVQELEEQIKRLEEEIKEQEN